MKWNTSSNVLSTEHTGAFCRAKVIQEIVMSHIFSLDTYTHKRFVCLTCSFCSGFCHIWEVGKGSWITVPNLLRMIRIIIQLGIRCAVGTMPCTSSSESVFNELRNVILLHAITSKMQFLNGYLVMTLVFQ